MPAAKKASKKAKAAQVTKRIKSRQGESTLDQYALAHQSTPKLRVGLDHLTPQQEEVNGP